MPKTKHRYRDDISSISNNSSMRDISVGTLDNSAISSIGNNSSLHDISSIGTLDKSDISSIGNSSSLRDISVGTLDKSAISSIGNNSSIHDISSIGTLDKSAISSIGNNSSLRHISPNESFDYSNDDTMSIIDNDEGEQHYLSDDESFSDSDDDDFQNLPPVSLYKSNNTTRADEDSSQDSLQGSLHLSDLMGGRRRTRKGRKGKKSKKSKKSRKGKKSKKSKKSRKSRKTRKMRGGALFGTGVGANNYDPNYSIYNTRELSLFPYKPN